MGKHSKKPIEQRLSIWEEEQLSKQRAKEALLLAKKQEQEKQKPYQMKKLASKLFNKISFLLYGEKNLKVSNF